MLDIKIENKDINLIVNLMIDLQKSLSYFIKNNKEFNYKMELKNNVLDVKVYKL